MVLRNKSHIFLRRNLLFLFGLLTFNCNAQDADRIITLKECLNLAIENNHLLKQAAMDYDISVNIFKETKANLYPQITTSIGLTDNISSPVVILPGELLGMDDSKVPLELLTPYDLSARIDMSQVIFDANLFSGIKIAKNIQELFILKKEFTKEEVLYNVGIVFYDILYSEKLLQNLTNNIELQDSIYGNVSLKKEHDLIRKLDLDRMKVELSTIRIQRDQLISKIEQQKKYLKILIGSYTKDHLSLDHCELNKIAIPEEIIDGSFDIYLNNEIQILNKQKDVELLNIRKVKNQYLPSLSFVASGGYSFQDNNLKLLKSNSWYDYSFIGIRLNLSVFDGFKKQKQLKQSKLNIDKIDEKIKYAYNENKISYENAIQDVYNGYKMIKLQENNLQLADKTYSQSRLLYKEGIYNASDLLQTKLAFQNAQSAYWLEVVKYKKNELKLMKVTGMINNLLD